jgi:hypothetical protein
VLFFVNKQVEMEVLEYSNLGKRDRDYEMQEAARTGIDNARKLLHILSHQQRSQLGDEESDAAAGVAVSKFQKVVSLLSRTGHARFRRAPPNPTISGYEYVFFESANFAQEEELKRIHLEKDHQSREKETMNFVPEPPAAPVAPSSAAAAAAVASVAAVVPQYPRPSSVSSPDGSSGHANSSVPAFLHHAQQLQQQQHLQLRQHQLQVQQQVQQQIQQQLLWQQQHVAPVGFVPVLPTPTEIISFGKQHQKQESSRSALMQEKASRSSQVDNSMSSGPPLSTTTKSGFSVLSMDRSGATDNNLQKQQQQTSSALSPAALEPRAQAGGGHHHAAAGNNNKKSSGITSDDNGGAKSSCASVGRSHRSKRR